jgi:hypothetical protein
VIGRFQRKGCLPDERDLKQQLEVFGWAAQRRGANHRSHCNQKEVAMTKVPAFHTTNPEYPPTHRDVFHDQSDCGYGKDIKPEDRVAGEGGRPRCHRCEDLE